MADVASLFFTKLLNYMRNNRVAKVRNLKDKIYRVSLSARDLGRVN